MFVVAIIICGVTYVYFYFIYSCIYLVNQYFILLLIYNDMP